MNMLAHRHLVPIVDSDNRAMAPIIEETANPYFWNRYCDHWCDDFIMRQSAKTPRRHRDWYLPAWQKFIREQTFINWGWIGPIRHTCPICNKFTEPKFAMCLPEDDTEDAEMVPLGEDRSRFYWFECEACGVTIEGRAGIYPSSATVEMSLDRFTALMVAYRGNLRRLQRYECYADQYRKVIDKDARRALEDKAIDVLRELPDADPWAHR